MAATRVEYRPLALDDLDAIFDDIAQDSPDRALAFVEDIQARCEALTEFPLRGPGRDDLAPGLRILPLPRRVIVAYVCTADSVTIVRLFYGGQDHETILRGANDLLTDMPSQLPLPLALARSSARADLIADDSNAAALACLDQPRDTPIHRLALFGPSCAGRFHTLPTGASL